MHIFELTKGIRFFAIRKHHLRRALAITHCNVDSNFDHSQVWAASKLNCGNNAVEHYRTNKLKVRGL